LRGLDIGVVLFYRVLVVSDWCYYIAELYCIFVSFRWSRNWRRLLTSTTSGPVTDTLSVLTRLQYMC